MNPTSPVPGIGRRPAPASPAPVTRRTLLSAAGACTATLALRPAGARAQLVWPARPIRPVVVYPAGGVGDSVARLLAPRLAERLGTQVVIENKGARAAASAWTRSRSRRPTAMRSRSRR
jgi:tripartite-type tricarboxylate transporter receptor subunit TctC